MLNARQGWTRLLWTNFVFAVAAWLTGQKLSVYLGCDNQNIMLARRTWARGYHALTDRQYYMIMESSEVWYEDDFGDVLEQLGRGMWTRLA